MYDLSRRPSNGSFDSLKSRWWATRIWIGMQIRGLRHIWYCCFRSILCVIYYLVPLLIHCMNDPTNLQTRYNFYQGILIIIISCRICRDSRSKLKKTTRTTWINSSEKRPDLGVIQDNQTKYNFELNCWSDRYKRTFYLKTNLCLHKFKLIGQPGVIACLDCVIIGTAFSLTVNQFTCPEHEP